MVPLFLFFDYIKSMKTKLFTLLLTFPLFLASCGSNPVEISENDFKNEMTLLEDKDYTKATVDVDYKGILPVFTIDENNNVKVDTITSDRHIKYVFDDLSDVVVVENDRESLFSGAFALYKLANNFDELKDEKNVKYFKSPLSVNFDREYKIHIDSVNIDLFYYDYVNMIFDDYGYVKEAHVSSALTFDMSSILKVEWFDFLENIKYIITLDYTITHL